MNIQRSFDIPEKWDGTYVLSCEHQLNHRSRIYYEMYCNVIKGMPDGRLKIRVFGNRYWRDGRINKSRIRYIEANRVCQYRKERYEKERT